MDPVDPKRRGRRLFGRRRQEFAAEDQMTESTSPGPGASTPGSALETAPDPPSDRPAEPEGATVSEPANASDTTGVGPDPGVIDLAADRAVAVDSLPAPGVGDDSAARSSEEGGPAGPPDAADPTPAGAVATEDATDAPSTAAADAGEVVSPPPIGGATGSGQGGSSRSPGSEAAVAAAAQVANETGVTHVPAEPVDGSDPDPAAETADGPEDGDGDEVEPYDLPRILAIANQKGGVGKTTTSVNLGAALAEMGYRVLVVDLDPQGNATTGLGVNARELEGSIYDVIMNDAAIEDCVEPTSLKNLFVAPATIDLAGAEIELVPAFSRELKLRRALHEIRDDYDYMLIDCPPSLGLLTVNGLAAADDVVVPIQCEYYALEGLSQLIRNVSLVQKNLNPSLGVRGIVLTMYDARTKLADQVEQEVRNHFGRTVYQTVVPRTVRLSEAPSFGQPIILFDPTSRGAVAYRELAKEVSSGATRRTG
jgi:chromosome partitioning protein